MAERANLVFHNKAIDRTAMKQLISRLIDHFGMAYTSHILDQVFTLVQDAEQQSLILEKHHHYGNVNAVEKLRQSIEIWYSTSEYLRQEMNKHLLMTDPYNPVYIMSFSGAIGNVYQVHQLVGMKELILDTQGQMIDLPMKSNLGEGLSLTEYLISYYRARKGVVDTAVRTSDARYLMCRLIENRLWYPLRSFYKSSKRYDARKNFDAIGRLLADDIYMGSQYERILDMSIMLWTESYSRRPSRIERSCRPGTQLILRTFHTGGVFTGVTAEHVRAPCNGKRKFNKDLVHPTRTPHGYPALLCYIDLYVTIESEDILHRFKNILRGNALDPNLLTYSNVHLFPKTYRLWILSGRLYGSNVVTLSLHKDQDQTNVHSLSFEQR
ncbi:hypothetical protein Cgig2_002575 [Carnegiea gigantea]|uniref:DNA-directed RNA polymerase n=1 Tax=Carnegiea gigantea TaxID=171969 RepID=A0A9Q1GKF8_9CARY|nr:hypothetical protein Cgig2_002575 [Carnegiea gigantea]